MARIKFGVGLYGTDSAQEAVQLARTADAYGTENAREAVAARAQQPKRSATTDSGSAIRT